jgi:hypothetical protein
MQKKKRERVSIQRPIRSIRECLIEYAVCVVALHPAACVLVAVAPGEAAKTSLYTILPFTDVRIA